VWPDVHRAAVACALLACALHAHAAGADDARWRLTPTLSASNLDNGRDSWRGAELDLSYTASPTWRVGADLEHRQRGDLSDTLFTASLSATPNRAWEWHVAAGVGPDAHFSARRSLLAGGEWRATPTLSLLLDYRQLGFEAGTVRELRPGVVVWFSDQTWLTLRYADGRAFGTTGFQSRSVRLDHVFAGQARVTMVYAHGADPERDGEAPGVLLTSADLFALTWRVPLTPRLALIAGADYEDRQPYYTRTGALLGVSVDF
jgi:YaiO family outer membrane protein